MAEVSLTNGPLAQAWLRSCTLAILESPGPWFERGSISMDIAQEFDDVANAQLALWANQTTHEVMSSWDDWTRTLRSVAGGARALAEIAAVIPLVGWRARIDRGLALPAAVSAMIEGAAASIASTSPRSAGALERFAAYALSAIGFGGLEPATIAPEMHPAAKAIVGLADNRWMPSGVVQGKLWVLRGKLNEAVESELKRVVALATDNPPRPGARSSREDYGRILALALRHGGEFDFPAAVDALLSAAREAADSSDAFARTHRETLGQSIAEFACAVFLTHGLVDGRVALLVRACLELSPLTIPHLVPIFLQEATFLTGDLERLIAGMFAGRGHGWLAGAADVQEAAIDTISEWIRAAEDSRPIPTAWLDGLLQATSSATRRNAWQALHVLAEAIRCRQVDLSRPDFTRSVLDRLLEASRELRAPVVGAAVAALLAIRDQYIQGPDRSEVSSRLSELEADQRLAVRAIFVADKIEREMREE